MDLHKPRTIAFREVYRASGWSIKIYVISKTQTFDHPSYYELAKAKLPEWLELDNSFVSSNEKIGFLILHPGSEGIFSLINWWVGDNMLNTHIFLTEPHEPDLFKTVSGDGLAPCIWEHEVIHHECSAWTHHVLKQATEPDVESYFKDVCNATL